MRHLAIIIVAILGLDLSAAAQGHRPGRPSAKAWTAQTSNGYYRDLVAEQREAALRFAELRRADAEVTRALDVLNDEKVEVDRRLARLDGRTQRIVEAKHATKALIADLEYRLHHVEKRLAHRRHDRRAEHRSGIEGVVFEIGRVILSGGHADDRRRRGPRGRRAALLQERDALIHQLEEERTRLGQLRADARRVAERREQVSCRAVELARECEALERRHQRIHRKMDRKKAELAQTSRRLAELRKRQATRHASKRGYRRGVERAQRVSHRGDDRRSDRGRGGNRRR